MKKSWAHKIQEFLIERERTATEHEFERFEPAPANLVHSRELLAAVGAEWSVNHLQRLRRVMDQLGWVVAPRCFRIHGTFGLGYLRGPK